MATEATHVYHQYTIRVTEDRDGFADALRNEYGVLVAGVYHRSRTTGCPRSSELDLPETEKAAAEVLSLPVHPRCPRTT